MLGGLFLVQTPALIHVSVNALITQKTPKIKATVFTASERVIVARKEIKPWFLCETISEVNLLPALSPFESGKFAMRS